MQIATHLLEGKVAALAKPLLVASRHDRSFLVDGIVRHRVLFSGRPKPIVGVQ